MSRVTSTERSIWEPFLWVAILLLIGLLHACGSEPTKTVQTAGSSFFPLSVGNKWYFSWDRDGGGTPSTDTVQIDAVSGFGGSAYYHLRCSWPGFRDGLWIRRDPRGNLTWSASGRGPEHQFLLFDVPAGAVWPTGLPECIDSLSMYGEYEVATTPYGRFDGVREIGDLGRCIDAGWGVKLARGVGPVAVSWITIAGPSECLLTKADVKDDASDAESGDVHGVIDKK